MSCIPPEAMRRNQLGDAAVLERRGAGWLLQVGGMDQRVVHAADTHYKLCGSDSGLCGVPRHVTCENEHSVTLLIHVHLQLD